MKHRKNVIKLTEAQLKDVITESVNCILKEYSSKYFAGNDGKGNFEDFLYRTKTKINDRTLYYLCVNLQTILQYYDELMNDNADTNSAIYNIGKFLHNFAPSEKQRDIPSVQELQMLSDSLVKLRASITNKFILNHISSPIKYALDLIKQVNN